MESGKKEVTENDETPKVSFSFNFFYELSNTLHKRLREGAFIFRRISINIDLKRASKCDELADVAADLCQSFASWPMIDPEIVAQERLTLPKKLIELQREAEILLSGIKDKLSKFG